MDPLLAAQWVESAKVAMLIALLLAAAIAGVRVARLLHIPRVVGYLLMGLLLRAGFRMVTGQPADEHAGLEGALELVSLFKSLALCLILFIIGVSLDHTHLRAIARHGWKLSLVEIAGVGLLVFVGTAVVGGAYGLPLAVLLAVAAIETAPAGTLLVLQQYGAKGPTTDHMLAMIGLNNLAAMTLFPIAFMVLAAIGPESGGLRAEQFEHGLLISIAYATAGSMAAGFLLGLGLSMLHTSLTRFETTLVFFGMMLTVSVAAKPLGIPYNPLLVALFAGLGFMNFSIQPRPFLGSLEPFLPPLFAIFFVLAGFGLELSRLGQVGLVGTVYIAARIVGKCGGAWLGVRWIGPRHRVPEYVGTAMLCQAGLAVGLVKYVVEHWGKETPEGFVSDPGALAFETIVLGAVAVFELAGPLATKRTMVQAGEVKAVTLLDRPSGSLREVSTILSRVVRAVVPGPKPSSRQEAAELSVRHLMRTRVDVLHDKAKMPEVLRFVEHSRLNHFFVVDDDGKLVGTIDMKDLRNLVFNPVLAGLLNAYDMANTAPSFVEAGQSAEDALDLFHKLDVAALPVVESAENWRMLGVIEQRDVLRALHIDNEESEEGH